MSSTTEISVRAIARFANLAYVRPKEGWTEKTTGDKQFTTIAAELVAMGVKFTVVTESTSQGRWNPSSSYIPHFTVFDIAYGASNKARVIAIKGTDNPKDVLIDVKQIVLGKNPEAILKMFAEVVTTARAASDDHVLVTGHSLGGYAAEIISTHTDIPGVGFQAPGPDTIGPFSNKHNGTYKNPGFHNVNAEHDPIGNVFPGVYGHKQWSVYAVGLKTPLISHKLTSMIKFLDTCTMAITNYNIYEYCKSQSFGYYLAPGTQDVV